jgi:carboxyl-terminal processing protease
MLKRILTLTVGGVLGLLLATVALQTAVSWGFLPNRDLNRAADYVKDVLETVNENYAGQEDVSYEKLAREAIHGMVGALDPHSEFLEAEDFHRLEDDLDGEFGGIGVQVEMKDGHLVVIAPISGTPGERAGILRGDVIESVDGELLEVGAPIDDAIKRLRGKPNTPVDVGIFRPRQEKHINLTLVREIIKVESVSDVKMLPGGLGYIQLVHFSGETGKQFQVALRQLVSDGARGLIIDLRNNPGGLLAAAVEVTEPFFEPGELVVYTQGRDPEKRENFRAGRSGIHVKLPIAVLINAGSASAAEIVTGALKDTNRAVVVGERSFGKGSVQTIFPLRNGEGMRLTTALYYTPSGISIHERGIEPQVKVVMTPEDDNKLRLQRARNDVTDPVRFEERFGFAPIEDSQLQAAIDVLNGVEMLNRTFSDGGTE